MMVAFFIYLFIFIYPLHDRVKEEDYFASLSSDVVSLVSYCCLWNFDFVFIGISSSQFISGVLLSLIYLVASQLLFLLFCFSFRFIDCFLFCLVNSVKVDETKNGGSAGKYGVKMEVEVKSKWG